MTWWIIVGIAVAVLIVLAITLMMLNRAWGEFPGRAGMPSASPQPESRPTPSLIWQSVDDAFDADDEEPGSGSLQTSGLIPVLNPVIRRAVEHALERGGSSYALYFVREGDNLFLNLDRIPDPETRLKLARTFHSLNNGDADLPGLSLGEMIRAIGQLGRQQ